MDVSLESTFHGSIGKETMEALRMAEWARRSAVEARASGMRASEKGEWEQAAEWYGTSLMLFERVDHINVEEEVNLGAVLLACLHERWQPDAKDNWWLMIEVLYGEAKEMGSQYCGDIAHFVFAVRMKYGDLDGAGLALSERNALGSPVPALDWELLDLEYSRSLLDVTQA